MFSRFFSRKVHPSVSQVKEFSPAIESNQENAEKNKDVSTFFVANPRFESRPGNSEIIFANGAKNKIGTVECHQETAVIPVNTDSDVLISEPDLYKNINTIAQYFTHDDIMKLKVIVGDMPYKTEQWYYNVIQLSIKGIGELADAYWRAKNFLIALKYYTEAAFLCVEQKKKSDEFSKKLYDIRKYFFDFPDLKEGIHCFLYSIRKYKETDRKFKSNEYYPFIKSSYERLLRIIDLEDLSDAIAADPQLAPVFPNSPPEIKDFISLFFNWIYKNDLGKFFSNQYSIPSFSDTVYMRAYERLLWVFKAKLLNAITGTRIGDGRLLLKMASAIQDSNGYLASEFAKKSVVVFKKRGDLCGLLIVHGFIEKSIPMNEFKDYIFEEADKIENIFNQFTPFKHVARSSILV